MNPEKISSLHDDLMVPKATEHLGEYRDYPDRFDPSEKSVLTRLEQFGIDIKAAEEAYYKKIGDFSWEEYSELVGEAIRARYDTIVGSVFDQYMFPTKENPDIDQRRHKMFELFEQYEEMEGRAGLHLIKSRADFGESGNVVLGLEAGAHLIKTMGDVKRLEDHGVKLFGLQYNTETPLADASGMTTFGAEVAQYLFDQDLIIDLAHSNYKTRQDVMALATELGKGHLVSYTHGASEQDISDSWKNKISERALKKEEIEQIVKMGGMIGLGVSEPFYSSARKVAERINETAQLDHGIEQIAIGTDFGGVPPEFLNDIKSPDDFKKLADILSADFGMSDEQVNKILRSNAPEWIKEAIK